MANATCFVVMGFGPKVDLATGRTLDMNKTYEFLIKPVLEDLSIDCIRADEIPHSGVIDVPMYEWLYKADLVVADISTANANAIYELGVRHALKPYTTIVMAEDKLIYPFDLNHISIMRYVHLGSDIGATTVLVDNLAHIGGLVAGLWFGVLFIPGRVPSPRSVWNRPGADPGTTEPVIGRQGMLAVQAAGVVGLLVAFGILWSMGAPYWSQVLPAG